jgi:hypothetical protein
MSTRASSSTASRASSSAQTSAGVFAMIPYHRVRRVGCQYPGVWRQSSFDETCRHWRNAAG